MFRLGRKLNKTNVFLCVLLAAALVVFAVSIDKLLETKTVTYASTVNIAGKEYHENPLMNYLVIGLDDFGYAGGVEGEFTNDKLADFVALVSFDVKNNNYFITQFNRDTILKIEELGISGERTGSYIDAQLALSHSFGDGGDISCRNTCRAVSDFLYGITINNYIALSMDAIEALNDYVGGVTLTCDEDYSDIDPNFTKGAKVTLLGENAMKFVRGRQGVQDQTNIARMGRQRIYLNALIDIISKNASDVDFVTGAYETLNHDGYMFTDMSVANIESVIDGFGEYEFKQIDTYKGYSIIDDDGHNAFYADEDDLDRLAIKYFYTLYEEQLTD